MIFECFIEGKGIGFLMEGKTKELARRRAVAFLKYWCMPTEGLSLKRHYKPRRRRQRLKKPLMYLKRA